MNSNVFMCMYSNLYMYVCMYILIYVYVLGVWIRAPLFLLPYFLIHIFHTRYRAALKELEVLHTLDQADRQGRFHCVKLLRNFMHRGHMCLVFEHFRWAYIYIYAAYFYCLCAHRAHYKILDAPRLVFSSMPIFFIPSIERVCLPLALCFET